MFQYVLEISKRVSLIDNPTTIILKHWPECVEFIENNEGNTLVHCLGGKSRSASTVMAYVMFKENLTSEQSIEKVRRLHKLAYPNAGFLKQLEYWSEIIQEYRKQIPVHNEKQDFKLLIEITSNKLKQVSSIILNPEQSDLAQISQKLSIVQIGNDKKINNKITKVNTSLKKNLLNENKQIQNQVSKHFEVLKMQDADIIDEKLNLVNDIDIQNTNKQINKQFDNNKEEIEQKIENK